MKRTKVDQTLKDYYCLSADSLPAAVTDGPALSGDIGFFQFGAGNICYGRCRTGVAESVEGSDQFDVLKHSHRDGTTIDLPFVFAEVVENLRRERYRKKMLRGTNLCLESVVARRFYYFIRNNLPTPIRRWLQRAYFRDWRELSFPSWPVDFAVDNLHQAYLRLIMEANGAKRIPFIWFWPQGAPNCLIVTHDVETSAGRDFTSQLMDLDDSYGFKASFQVIPEGRYELPNEYVNAIRSRGFEFNIHDLNHDGRLYLEEGEFLRRAARINAFAHRYEARGFRAGSMYRNQDWHNAFDFDYDMSVPNVAHLDPMRGGCCTVMPYFAGKILELPLTTAQDYTFFHILKIFSIDLWKGQLNLIRERNGLMSILTHPDYLIENRERNSYRSLLDYVRTMVDREKIWAALPGDVNSWWRARSQMKLVRRGNEWEITGPEKERARLAYAVLDGSQLIYELAEIPPRERLSQ